MIANDKTTCLRVAVPDESNSISMPCHITSAVFRNDGVNDLRLNFGNDVAADYFTLKPGSSTHTVQVSGGKVVNTDGVAGSSYLEVIAWG